MRITHQDGPNAVEIGYDQLVLALGVVTNFFNTPGLADHALTMKTLGDAMLVRNRVIDALELADNQPDETRRNKFYPPTAQHATRQAAVLAGNILAVMRAQPPRPFKFKMLGMLAAIGRRTGVAEILGMRFSGFIAWWLWWGIYLSKLPGFQKKVRVALDWVLDLVFSKDIVQLPTLRPPALSEEEESPTSSSTTKPSAPSTRGA